MAETFDSIDGDLHHLFLEAEKFEQKGELRKAFKALSTAASKGHLWSQLNLGHFSANGTGVKKNLVAAEKLYKNIYRHGDSVGAQSLAIDYERQGNDRQSIIWFAV
jgi:TPR repeat protein